MHPRIAELVACLDAETEKLGRLYESIPAERRAVRPAADRWSPADPALDQFTGYDWIAFAGTHVARHAAQIREGL